VAYVLKLFYSIFYTKAKQKLKHSSKNINKYKKIRAAVFKNCYLTHLVSYTCVTNGTSRYRDLSDKKTVYKWCMNIHKQLKTRHRILWLRCSDASTEWVKT